MIRILIIFLMVNFFTYVRDNESFAENNFKLEQNKIREYAITFKVFEKEFIFTNSVEDYYRSFKRLISKYNIVIPQEVLPEILLPLTEIEKDFVKITVSNLAYEANQFSYYKDNNYYITLNKIVNNIKKLNIAAALEIALVNDYKKKVSKPSHVMRLSSSATRYLYLINHARFEIMSVTLHHKNKIN